MLGGVRRWLTARLGSDDDTADEESANTRFVPSVLDASVRYAHGGGSTEGEREITTMQEEARRLEEQRREE